MSDTSGAVAGDPRRDGLSAEHGAANSMVWDPAS